MGNKSSNLGCSTTVISPQHNIVYLSEEEMKSRKLEVNDIIKVKAVPRPPPSSAYPGQVARAQYNRPKRPGPKWTCAIAKENGECKKGEIGINQESWKNAVGPGDIDPIPGVIKIEPYKNIQTASLVQIKSFTNTSGKKIKSEEKEKEIKDYLIGGPVTVGDSFKTGNGLWGYVMAVSTGDGSGLVNDDTKIEFDSPTTDVDPEILAIVGSVRLGHSVDAPVYLGEMGKGLTLQEYKKIPVREITDISSEDGCWCGICVEDFNIGDSSRKLPHCQHQFHKNCIDRWLVDHDTCPECRASCHP